MVASWALSQLPPAAADEAALRPLPRRDALGDAAKLAAPAADRRQPGERRPRRRRIQPRRALPAEQPRWVVAGWALYEAAAAL